MAKKIKSIEHENVNNVEETIVTKSPLVFISHDTKDAEIAEAFSKLLSNVSAGMLKSFRSSDKKGTQGIEYGVEWFPEIMKKLKEASDIVCLLTQSSIDRPWILYEAGVAKGKLDTTVFGISLGLPLNKASHGPFAQFQNCADDEESLTKLVMQLVKRLPNSEPVEEVVKDQVKTFKQKLSELLKKQPKPRETSNELKEDTSIAKLFEEVKIMFQDLPSRIDKRLEPDLVRRKRKFHPFMMEEFMHIGRLSEDEGLGFLIMISFFKDDFPWLYEVGLTTYQGIVGSKNLSEKKNLMGKFQKAMDLLGHPIFREFYGKGEDLFFLHKGMRHYLYQSLDHLVNVESSKK